MGTMQRYGCLLAASMTLASVTAQAYVIAQPTEDGPEVQARLAGDWQPVYEEAEGGVRTWARLESNKPWRSFKVEARLPGTLEAVERVLFDFEGYKRWYWQVRNVQLLKTVSSEEYYLYVVHDSPLDLADRDAVLHVRIEPRGAGQNFARLRINAEPGYLPTQAPLVRMPAEDMVITLTPEGNTTRLQAEGHFALGGHEPLWVVNALQRFVPYRIASNLVQVTEAVNTAMNAPAAPFRLRQPR